QTYFSAEKHNKAPSFNMNLGRTLSGVEQMQRKLPGRKVDLLFYKQSLEFGCCECGRRDDATKELYDGSFKTARVLKEMVYTIFKSAPWP
ncbi:hypothetical protein BD560DRAFT_326134, partial [Blakeslea trispora]